MVGPGDDTKLSAFWNMCFLSPPTLEIVAPPLSTSNISFLLGRSLPYLKYVFKGPLSGLRQFLAIESPLKMMKNAFYFTSKALLVLKIFKSCLDLLVMYRNGLIKKMKIISNFMTSQSG